MLATILKSPKATQTNLVIIDTFSKVREVGRIVNQLPAAKENSPEQQKLTHRAGEIIAECNTVSTKPIDVIWQYPDKLYKIIFLLFYCLLLSIKMYRKVLEYRRN